MKSPLPRFAALLLATALAAQAAVMTNADVIKLVESGVEEAVVIDAITHAESGFDVSADGLISLSRAKVSRTIISAVIRRANQPATSMSSASLSQLPAAGTSGVSTPSAVVMRDGRTLMELRYLTTQTHKTKRLMGLMGKRSDQALKGAASSLRVVAARPTFLVSVPTGHSPEKYLSLVKLEAEPKDNVRLVPLESKDSTALTPKALVDCKVAPAADQTRVTKGFTLHEVTPRSTLEAGEYALVVHAGEAGTVVDEWFSAGGNAYFDFGVDR